MRRLRKIVLWTLGILIGLVIVAVVAVRLFFPLEKAKAYAIERGSAALGRPLEVETVDVSFWGGLGVNLEDVSVGSPGEVTPEKLFAADNVDVKLRLWPLLRGDLYVDRLIVERPTIYMVKRPEGTNNYTFAAVERRLPPDVRESTPPEAKAAVSAISFDRLEVSDGRLVYADDSSGMQVKADGLSIRTSLENVGPNRFRSAGRILVETLQLNGKQTMPQYTVALKYDAEYDHGSRNIDLAASELSINGLRFDLEGEAQLGQAPIVRLDVRSSRVSVADLLNLVPEARRQELADFSVDGDFTLTADLDYDDRRTEPLAYAGTVVLEDVAISRENIPGKLRFQRALVDFKTDNLRFNIEDGTFDDKPLRGNLLIDDFDDPHVGGELAGEINLAFAEPFLPPEHKHQLAGDARFDVNFSGRLRDFRNMDFSGEISVTDGTYRSELLPEPLDAVVLAAYVDNETVKIEQCSGSMPSGEFDITGRFEQLPAYLLADSASALMISPTFDVSVQLSMDVSLLNAYLDPQDSMQLAGQADVDLALAGDLTDPASLKPRGNVLITEAKLYDPRLPEPLEELKMQLALSPDTISIRQLSASFTSSDLSLTGKLIDPFPYLLKFEGVDRQQPQKPLLLFDLTSRRFDTDRMFPEAVPGSGTNRAAAEVDSVFPLVLPDIAGRGSFKIDTLIYCQVEFTSITGEAKIYDGKIDCFDVAGKAYTGTISGNTVIDLNDFENPRYAGEFQAEQIEADDFVSRFTVYGGHVFGKMNLTGSYSAVGWEPEALLNSLTMNSSFHIHDGAVETSQSLQGLLSGLADKIGEKVDQRQALKDLNTAVTVKDGKVQLDKLTTKLGGIGDVTVDGFYSFDGGLGYSGSILLSEGYTEKIVSQGGILGQLGGILKDKSIERIGLPFVVSGTADKPSLSIDYAALTKAMGENLSNQVGDFFKDLIKK